MSLGENVAVVAALIAAGAAIVSAAISALISLSVSKRSGSQKVAEFRKDWLDELRSHLAGFHTATNHMLALKNLSADKELSAREEVESWMKCFSEASYIELMLNPNEKTHVALISEMHRILAPENKDLNLKEFRKLAREVLKIEWDRLKIETAN